MKIYFIGGVGSDAGGWYIGPDGKIHRVPGWNPEQLSELRNAAAILVAAQGLKTPGLAEAVTHTVAGFVQKELGQHLGEGEIAVVS